MDILKAEVERKKRELESMKLVGPQKKYFKRGDLLKQQEEQYWKEHHQKYQGANDEQNEKSKLDNNSKDKETETVFPRKEVIRRLRDRNEPILLFGETEIEAFERLRRLEILEPEMDRGFRNDFQEALEKVDQAYMDEIMKTQGRSTEGKSINDVKVEDDSTTMEEIMAEATEKLGKGNNSDESKLILKFLKYLLRLWGQKLNSRLENEKTCMKGKLASATYSQTQNYIHPLFRRLKNETVPDDILEHLVLIVNYMLDRNYVKANDAYLQMAIGNAPWPIGVTMVGIHARTGREKIFSRNIAHVLNDETQRKFIQKELSHNYETRHANIVRRVMQMIKRTAPMNIVEAYNAYMNCDALKRLMTQCQRFFPTDPSRSVEYNA